jgi:predicted alpha/beta superfamily hydrolase
MKPVRAPVALATIMTALFFGSSEVRSQNVDVIIRVVLPAGTSSNDRITVAGNHALLGSWDPSVSRLTRVSDSIAEGRFEIPRGTHLEFKVTRGTWDTEAIYLATGEVPSNTVIRAERGRVVVVRPLGWKDRMSRPTGTLTGEVRTHPDLAGIGLRYRRTVTVRLPRSYGEEPQRRYPVLYMHDGQNCLDRATAAFSAEWRADEVMDSLALRGAIEEVIIVAINNTSDRIAEYSDTPKGRAYASFVVEKVKTLVDSLYRTKPEAEHTAVMGSSMGGLISFLFTWWYPDVFGKSACLSSVFDRERTHLIGLVESETHRRVRLRVYMDCGGAPGEVSLNRGMEEMVRVLAKRGYRRGEDFEWFFDPLADHSERAWASRLWRPMEFLFGRNR